MKYLVRIGNPAPIETKKNEDGTRDVKQLEVGEQYISLTIDDGDVDLQTVIQSITHDDGVINNQIQAGYKPSWVECDEKPILAQFLAEIYGCPVATKEQAEAIVAQTEEHGQVVDSPFPAVEPEPVPDSTDTTTESEQV